MPWAQHYAIIIKIKKPVQLQKPSPVGKPFWQKIPRGKYRNLF
jgi:hypothetical protein